MVGKWLYLTRAGKNKEEGRNLIRGPTMARDWMGLQNGTRLLIVRITPGTYSTIDSWPYFPGRLEKVCTLYLRLVGLPEWD
jgi:hypothetical protein